MENKWMSLLASLISIKALMLSYRVVPVDFKDYWGFVLGIFTLLVTILIGWQIYNSLDMKKQLEETRKKQLEINKQIEDFKRYFNIVECGLNHSQGLFNSKDYPLAACRDFLIALNSAYKCNKYDAIDGCYNNLNAIIHGGTKVDEDVESRKREIEIAIDNLRKNIKYDQFRSRIEPLVENINRFSQGLLDNNKTNFSDKV